MQQRHWSKEAAAVSDDIFSLMSLMCAVNCSCKSHRPTWWKSPWHVQSDIFDALQTEACRLIFDFVDSFSLAWQFSSSCFQRLACIPGPTSSSLVFFKTSLGFLGNMGGGGDSCLLYLSVHSSKHKNYSYREGFSFLQLNTVTRVFMDKKTHLN